MSSGESPQAWTDKLKSHIEAQHSSDLTSPDERVLPNSLTRNPYAFTPQQLKTLADGGTTLFFDKHEGWMQSDTTPPHPQEPGMTSNVIKLSFSVEGNSQEVDAILGRLGGHTTTPVYQPSRDGVTSMSAPLPPQTPTYLPSARHDHGSDSGMPVVGEVVDRVADQNCLRDDIFGMDSPRNNIDKTQNGVVLRQKTQKGISALALAAAIILPCKVGVDSATDAYMGKTGISSVNQAHGELFDLAKGPALVATSVGIGLAAMRRLRRIV